jgi:BASS family bile acid:Na+ symporter
MSAPSRLLVNSPFIFAVSIILGLILPGPAANFEPLVTPALLVMMTFSLTEMDLRERGDMRGALTGLAMNYAVLSGLILLLSFALEDDILRYGLVVMASVPPAIAVLPLTKLLDGDIRLSLYGETLCYAAGIVLMPGIIFIFTSRSDISLQYLSETALLLIILPAVLSRFARRIRLNPVLPINAGFFLINYTVLGLNSGLIFRDIGPLASIAFIRTFLIGTAVYLLARHMGVLYPKRISYTLFGSYKNLGLAAALSITLFGPAAGAPIAVCILFETMFYILISFVRSRASLK